MLSVNNISKKFGNLYAVNNLSFEVNKGEIFGFLGPNGAGKTTTMRILTGYMPATAGYFRVNSLDSRKNDLEIKQHMGYLPEHTPLYGDLFVDEYLEYAGKIRSLNGKTLHRACKNMIDLCGLGDVRKKTVGKLSKGYRQRVGLAQAMLHDPELLILDEPLSGLDPNQIVEIRNLIREVGKEKTVLYCSHILSEVDKTCDRLLIINNGKTVALDTPEAIVSSSEHYSRYDIQGKFPSTLTETLEKKPFVASVTEITPEKHLRIMCRDTALHGPDIISTATAAGGTIEECLRHKESLETIFTTLTTEEGAAQ